LGILLFAQKKLINSIKVNFNFFEKKNKSLPFERLDMYTYKKFPSNSERLRKLGYTRDGHKLLK
jgi:hypothetical protein